MKTIIKTILTACGIYLVLFAGYQWFLYCATLGQIWGFTLLISPMVIIISLLLASVSDSY